MGPARLAWRQTRGIGASSAGLSASAQYATACGCTPCIDAGTAWVIAAALFSRSAKPICGYCWRQRARQLGMGRSRAGESQAQPAEFSVRHRLPALRHGAGVLQQAAGVRA